MLKNSDPEKAARAYLEYLQEMDIQNVSDRDEQGKAHIFLANYYFTKKDFDSSHKHAFKCLEFPEVIINLPYSMFLIFNFPIFLPKLQVKDEAKALLIQLAATKLPDQGEAERAETTDMDISTAEEKPAPHANENPTS